jgi:hypothetical protein
MTTKRTTTSEPPGAIERRLSNLTFGQRALLAGWLSKLTQGTNPALAERLQRIERDARRHTGNARTPAA